LHALRTKKLKHQQEKIKIIPVTESKRTS